MTETATGTIQGVDGNEAGGSITLTDMDGVAEVVMSWARQAGNER